MFEERKTVRAKLKTDILMTLCVLFQIKKFNPKAPAVQQMPEPMQMPPAPVVTITSFYLTCHVYKS